MPRIQPIRRENTAGQLAVTLDAVKAKVGMLPNLLATLANSESGLNAYLSLSEALAGGRLTAAQREVIALAIGQANKCQYCLSAHTLISKGAGLSEPAIQAARAGRGESALDSALAGLAVKLVNQRGQLSDADVAGARSAGVDDGLIVEVIAHVALNTLTNYTNHVAATDIDFPVVPL
ncbi:carboxymuconolactone decarboxylase family protein [Dechloromonas sp. ARDL1]|uniref:carboxymuconolactone decarboxylase family protein n=1 Tax=Dechloromonas sp. ARDL1 TaxID=3322121 RepID=UPI003DA76AFE